MQSDRAVGFVDRAQNGDIPETDQEFTYANSVNDHRDPSALLA
jgi:hypothetical protein